MPTLQIKELSDDSEKRILLERIVALEGEVTETKSENSKLSTQMDNFSKVIQLTLFVNET